MLSVSKYGYTLHALFIRNSSTPLKEIRPLTPPSIRNRTIGMDPELFSCGGIWFIGVLMKAFIQQEYQESVFSKGQNSLKIGPNSRLCQQEGYFERTKHSCIPIFQITVIDFAHIEQVHSFLYEPVNIPLFSA